MRAILALVAASTRRCVVLATLNLKRPYVSDDVGIRNDLAEAFSCKAIHRYGGEIFQHFKCGEPATCSMRVQFGKLDSSIWPVHATGLDEELLRGALQNFFARQVVPTIGQLNSLDDFLELLVADKLYFPWSGSNGAIRATQVVAIAGQIGLNDDFVRAMLEPRLKLIAAGLSKTSEMRADPKAYVERILEDWKLR